MKRMVGVALVAAFTVAAAGAAKADGPPWGPETPNFNLEAVLRPAAAEGEGFGLVKFRQPNDSSKVIYLDVWVRDLAPTHAYYLQRATDATVNDDCTGTNWLTLGQGLVPQAIVTDDTGTGRAALFRDLGSVPTGTQLDIHFRVIDGVTSAVVLQSACYQFTVSE
jgi:hypothetical protein